MNACGGIWNSEDKWRQRRTNEGRGRQMKAIEGGVGI